MKTPLSGAPAAGSGCCWERLRSPLLQEKQRGRYFIRCYLLDLSYTDLVSPTGYGRQACCSHPLPPGAEGALEGKLPRCPSARGAGGRRGAFPPPPPPSAGRRSGNKRVRRPQSGRLPHVPDPPGPWDTAVGANDTLSAAERADAGRQQVPPFRFWGLVWFGVFFPPFSLRPRAAPRAAPRAPRGAR